MRSRRSVWFADAGLEAALRSARLLDADGIRAALAQASGATGRARTALLVVGDARLVLRSVRRGGLLGPWLGGTLLGPDRPLREIAATAALRSVGAPVPRPAFGGAFRSGLAWNGAVATWLEADARDAETWLRAAPAPDALARALASAGRAVRRFHDAGGSHADLHLKNLLVRETDGACEVVVIDLDGACVLAEVPARRRMAELMRLYRSVVKRELQGTIGAREAERFFDAYVGGDASLRSALLARLPAERRRVARHALGYRRSR